MSEGSGNLLADRRYTYAEAAFRDGDAVAAADLARQTLELAPSFAAGWFLLGQACVTLDQRDEAIQAFRKTLTADPADRLGARLRLAALAAADPLGAMSPSYIRTLFDEYAGRFDRHLTQSLRYRGPALLHDAVRRACSLRLRPFAFAEALDLGCGTGLAAQVFRPQCTRLAGVDLSAAMVAKARAKKLYDELASGDLVAWLGERPGALADLVLAADVFVYVGDLDPVFQEAARVLAPDGLFAFTVQASTDAEVALGDDLRFAHSEPYLRRLADEVGLTIVALESCTTREDRGEPVPGLLAVMSRSRP